MISNGHNYFLRSRSAIQSSESTLPTNPISLQKRFNDTMDRFAPLPFSGSRGDDPEDWFQKFELYCNLRDYDDNQRQAAFALSLCDAASRWYQMLPSESKNDINSLRQAFVTRFAASTKNNSERMQELWTAKQNPTEPVRDFIDRMRQLSVGLEVSDGLLYSAILAGLRSDIRQHVARTSAKSVKELTDQAILAEATNFTSNSIMPDSITEALQRLERKFEETQVVIIGRNQEILPGAGCSNIFT